MPSTIVRSPCDIEKLQNKVRDSALTTHEKLTKLNSGSAPLETLHTLKFEGFGCRPLEEHSLNLIEQLNQAFTIMASLAAARRLLDWFPQCCGFHLNLATTRGPDIESITPNLVVAEVFAAVRPSNNGKLTKDIGGLQKSTAAYRYVFFYAPCHKAGRQYTLEENYWQRQQGAKVQIWALDKSEIM